jgi:tetratricopeptide (TPR) repeat protein
VEAAVSFRQALAGEPLNPRISFDLGAALSAAGQHPGAVLAFEHAAGLDPANPEAWFQLGNAQYQSGDRRRAGQSYQRAMELRPDHAESHYNLGVVLMEERQTAPAAECSRRAIELNPGYAEAHNNLALLAHAAGHLESAEQEYRLAFEARGGFETAAYNLARLFQDRGELERCRDAYRALLARCPDLSGNSRTTRRGGSGFPILTTDAAASCALAGNSRTTRHGRSRLPFPTTDAAASCALADPHTNLGNALRALGEVPEAVEEYRAALRLDPASASAHFNLGLALLELGEWKEGWGLHEWRPQRPAARQVLAPRWAGTPLAGRSILIHCEQGLGDTLQFSRFAPLVGDRGGQVLLECQPALARLLTTLDAVNRVIPQGEDLPEFDCQAPLLSLPAILETTVATVPCEAPYLLADRELVEQWSKTLAETVDPGLFRVGLTWAGSAAHPNDAHRSIPASSFDTLSGVVGVAWFNLQKDRTDAPVLKLLPMAERRGDFADTAASILNLDLVISVDTSVAHLAGALGKPVWTLLPFAADWRWMRDRSDTPWYPTMRLFRQPRRGEWGPVMASVGEELEKVLGARRQFRE